MENLIEELTKVNPANLSEEGLKLFNKINEIIDRNRELEGEIENWKFTAKYVEDNYIDKIKIKEIVDDIDNNKPVIAEQKLRKLLQEGDK